MAPAMTYALRAEAVLTRDGQDLLDSADRNLLVLLRDGGARGASQTLGVAEGTVLGMVQAIEQRLGQAVLENGTLNRRGNEILDMFDMYVRMLDAQIEHLWRKPSLTCDGLVISGGEVLLVRRGKEPFRECHALPGGFIEYGESAEECVVREVREETGLDTEVVRLLGAYSKMGRDPRGHFVTLLYLLRRKGGSLRAGDDAVSARFFKLTDLPELAFDHGRMIEDGVRAAEHNL